jgi:predicted PurR-regulated permease PerM
VHPRRAVDLQRRADSDRGQALILLERLLRPPTAGINDLLHLENLDVVGAAQTFFSSLGSVTGPAFGFLGDALNALINLTFLLVMMFYLMRDGEKFAHSLIDITPVSYHDDARRMLVELARVWNAYLRGQILISVITGVVIFLAAVILGVPNALILGVFSGVLQLIPNIGPFLAAIPAAFLALVNRSHTLPSRAGWALRW